MSSVGVDAARSFVRARLTGDTGSGGLFETGDVMVRGVFEESGRDEGGWPRLLIRVSGASSDAASAVMVFSVTLIAETDSNGDLDDRGLNLAHAIINRVRARLEGHSGSVTDSESATWRFSPVERVQGSQSAEQRVNSQWNRVAETYILIGTTGSSTLRVQSESSITSTGITSTLGLDPRGFSIRRSVEMVETTPIGITGGFHANDFEVRMETGPGRYEGSYRGLSTGKTPDLPASGGSVRLSLSDADYYETTDGVFGQFRLSTDRSRNGEVVVDGTIHLNPGVTFADG